MDNQNHCVSIKQARLIVKDIPGADFIHVNSGISRTLLCIAPVNTLIITTPAMMITILITGNLQSAFSDSKRFTTFFFLKYGQRK